MTPSKLIFDAQTSFKVDAGGSMTIHGQFISMCLSKAQVDILLQWLNGDVYTPQPSDAIHATVSDADGNLSNIVVTDSVVIAAIKDGSKPMSYETRYIRNSKVNNMLHAHGLKADDFIEWLHEYTFYGRKP